MQTLNIQNHKNNNNVAWVFPGQSSQKPNMERGLLAYPFAKAKFKQAQQILGWSIIEACQNPHKLSRTLYTQPCLYVVEVILAELLKKRGYQPSLVAGYSLGEYAAIHIAGAFDFETGLRLIKRRAELMDRSPKGKMVALVGCNQKQLQDQIRLTPNVWRMNDDPHIAIISGSFRGIQSLLDTIPVQKAIPLKVSCPFHTPLMAEAALEFQEVLESISFKKQLEIPMVSSTEIVPTLDVARLKNSLIQQIYEPVKWRAISLLIASQGIKEVVEIGPGDDLIRQMRRTCPDLIFSNLNNFRTGKQNYQSTECGLKYLNFV